MPVRVGFVGAGGIACAHMNLLQIVEDVQIVAIADSIKTRAESVASRYLAKAYDSYEEMFENEALDAVYVCVPPCAHGMQEIIAAQKGIHIFVEKPVGTSIEKSQEILKAIKANDIVTAVGYHWRYQSNTDRAKNILKDKQIGMIQGYWLGGFPEVHWWRRMDESGGQMVEQTTHIFDLARYLCGEVTEVYAAFGRRALKKVSDLDIYDVGTATLKFASGAVGSISNTCILDVPYTVGMHVIAKDLVLEIHGDLKVVEPGHKEIFQGGENPMLEENKAFINAVKTGDRSLIRSDYEDALKTLAVTLACNESAASGKPVSPSF